ncbi:IPExxxVDY family protein [Joostella atrarenae]|uniref:IPExxxVDY family protein n=1 Tax=Joostella atrarenae TaxID=679257 RepID=A0ABS9IYZ7_9FLAO|nr:IPExxxVDY family protein [Joostella atrarenae]MCF8713411.1 IPExxxVDY family protein [Joostella atrarenae]
MAIYKLLDDFYEHSYTLIAIHGSLDDYRLAYFLNSEFKINLRRLKTDVNIAERVNTSVFKSYDDVNEVSWSLIKNRINIEQIGTEVSLFAEKKSVKRFFFIPEYSKADYFLKIDEDGPYRDEIKVLVKLKKIPGIITAYKVEAQQLKSKNNLIFLTNA